MGGVEGDIQGGAAGNPIKGEGEPFRSLCAQVKLSDLVVVITALSRFFFIIIRVAKPRLDEGLWFSRTWVRSPPIAYFFYSARASLLYMWYYFYVVKEVAKHGTQETIRQVLLDLPAHRS